ncbi:hypothetical protein J1N35_006996 [Gossypium stocksii]|uniref:Uncharacterized protein n=1 Tax=Gossypium stocksii TaxID=47602 RepID=A0A9D3W6Q2_9ROSI|nr:hypothetical protein J1N35_006996 [Gossypium stocksii]
MAMASVRSGLLRAALRGGSRPTAPPKRGFASSSHHDDAYETAKWEKITYLGVATCTVLAIYNLSKGHPHHEEPPAYPYLHIRNKEFPWGIQNTSLGNLYGHLKVANSVMFCTSINMETSNMLSATNYGPDGLFEKKEHH